MGEEIAQLQSEYLEFIAERRWEKYHTPKSTAMSIAIEAGELMEIFQWHDNLDPGEYEEETREATKEELADVLIYSLSLAHQLDIDLEDAIREKLRQNQERFDADTVDEINQNLDQWLED